VSNTVRRIVILLLLCGALACADSGGRFAFPEDRLLIGVGDRMTIQHAGGWSTVPALAEARDLRIDLLEIWLTRDWTDTWVTREQLEGLAAGGVTPVVMHYFFGDDISVERVQTEREAWFSSLWRLSQLVSIDAPVLVVLEPEWNVHAPEGEHAVVDSPWFAQDLINAARMIREHAPKALVGVCPGDFSPDRNLDRVLGEARDALDFLAFQEMRASTDPLSPQPGYLDVGAAAVDYASYLSESFELPVLLAYVAISSYQGWESAQVRVLEDLAARRVALQRAGVFGLVYFQLRDDPAHEGYFGPAEPHFGLVRADGSPKPGLAAFRKLQGTGRAPNARGR
jgi:hypothetical protein